MSFIPPKTPLVVDASAAVGLIDEADETIVSMWQEWLDEDRPILAVPLIWLEVANALLRGRGLHAVVVGRRLESLEDSGLEVADRGQAGVRASLDLAERHRLTVYDASYLWLAIDVDGELATRDADLIRAAEAEGVPLALG